MSDKGKFPRIWDRTGKRIIIGETRVSWIVYSECGWLSIEQVKAAIPETPKPYWWKNAIVLVNKKKPNKNDRYPEWFFTENDWVVTVWAAHNRYNVARQVESSDPEMLRRVADLIGYIDKKVVS